MSETCRIQWIDENGKPTPDENPAVGYAVNVRRYTYGTAVDGSKVEIFRYPCCAQHKAQAEADRLFERGDPVRFAFFGYDSTWHFEAAK